MQLFERHPSPDCEQCLQKTRTRFKLAEQLEQGASACVAAQCSLMA
jgi:hypothetical protein